MSAELEKVGHDNSHLTALTNQHSTSDDRDLLNRKLTYLHNQNGIPDILQWLIERGGRGRTAQGSSHEGAAKIGVIRTKWE